MNHVNLIGKICSEPKVIRLNNGRKIAQFAMSTQEDYLDASGNMKKRSQWHRLTAWGTLVSLFENNECIKGLGLAVEGKLTSRFYKTPKGDKKLITEVEINDLVIL